MAEQRVEQHFIDGADFLYQAAAPLAKPLADAAHGIVASLAGGGKVMVLGQGASALDALRFAGFLLGGLERERPPLPTLVQQTLPRPTGYYQKAIRDALEQ